MAYESIFCSKGLAALWATGTRQEVKVKVKSAFELVDHQGSAYLQFLLHEPTRTISTPPGRGVHPLQGYPQH